MSSRSGSPQWPAVIAFLVVSMVSYGARLVAGDVEVFCNATGQHTERWSPTPSLQCVIYFRPAFLGGSGPFIPGGRSTTCGAGAINEPGMQSLMQAIATWNSATIPGTTILGSSFSFAIPSVLPNPGNVNITDTVNEVDLYPQQNWFKSNGLSGVLSISPVNVAANGDILGADVIVNTTQIVGGTPTSPLWSFLEYNYHPMLAQWIVTDTPNNAGGGAPTPFFGFVDLQGDITHELGHMTGLGHSVVDSSASSTGSGFPTMFPFAQAEPFSRTVNKYFGTCGPATWSGPLLGVVIGTSAQTLEYDDVVALSRQYSSSGFNTLGKIIGTITDSLGAPILGAAVVAVPKSTSATPNEFPRIQTLSYGGGSYSLEGLIAGDYYVYIEPVDQDPLGNSDPQYYFANFNDIPNYVDLIGNGGCINYVPFQTEFYNYYISGAGDQSLEVQCAASTITLTTLASGSVSTASNVNLVTSLNPNILTVGVVLGGVSPAYHSPRGVRFALPAGGAGSRVVEFVIHAGAAFAGYHYGLQFAEVRTTNLVTTVHPLQLDQIIQTSNPNYPVAIGGMLNGSGDAVIQLAFSSPLQYDMVFAQADVGPIGGEVYSNCINIWVGQ